MFQAQCLKCRGTFKAKLRHVRRMPIFLPYLIFFACGVSISTCLKAPAECLEGYRA